MGDVRGDVLVGDGGGELEAGGGGRGLNDCLAKLYMLSGAALGSSFLVDRGVVE